MRVLVIAEPAFPIPPEQLGALLQGFAAWRERYRDRLESFFFFAGGGGGGGILNVEDEAALNRVMLEWPLLMFSKMQYRPILEGDEALRQWQDALQQMAGGGR